MILLLVIVRLLLNSAAGELVRPQTLMVAKISTRPTRQHLTVEHLSVGSGHWSEKNSISPVSLFPPRQKVAALGQWLGV
jgi:hypothetical protein